MAITLPSGLEARLSYDKFTVASQAYVEPVPDMPWLHGEVQVRIPGRTPVPDSDWCLVARAVDRDTLDGEALRHTHRWQAYLDHDVTGSELCLRPRRTGDRFWPQGLGDRPTTVGNFMINAKIPRAWRDGIPLLVSPGQVLWLAGWRIDERAKVTERTTRVLALCFEHPNPRGEPPPPKPRDTSVPTTQPAGG
jgi:tRNA(Ile)-lysidine synthase